jgi:hypothetical protein
MTTLNIELPRHKIAHNFAQWTALSALRSGSPLKSRDDIYPFVDLKTIKKVLKTDKPISEVEFNRWDEKTLRSITSDDRLQIGWAAKIVNVYLKSMCYLSGIGRQGLVNYIHPPIDSGLWKGLEKRYKSNTNIGSEVFSKTKIFGKAFKVSLCLLPIVSFFNSIPSRMFLIILRF